MSAAMLLRFWREGAIAALAIMLGAAWLMLRAESEAAQKWQARSREWQSAHERLAGEIRSKTELAKARDAANAARVERRQDRISQEVRSDYQQELADLRGRHDALRLRAAAARADPGGGGGAAMPGLSDSAGRADGAASEDRLPAEDALIASEQALRLKALQDWVERQRSASAATREE